LNSGQNRVISGSTADAFEPELCTGGLKLCTDGVDEGPGGEIETKIEKK
jgi:hypothetical protein